MSETKANAAIVGSSKVLGSASGLVGVGGGLIGNGTDGGESVNATAPTFSAEDMNLFPQSGLRHIIDLLKNLEVYLHKLETEKEAQIHAVAAALFEGLPEPQQHRVLLEASSSSPSSSSSSSSATTATTASTRNIPSSASAPAAAAVEDKSYSRAAGHVNAFLRSISEYQLGLALQDSNDIKSKQQRHQKRIDEIDSELRRMAVDIDSLRVAATSVYGSGSDRDSFAKKELEDVRRGCGMLGETVLAAVNAEVEATLVSLFGPELNRQLLQLQQRQQLLKHNQNANDKDTEKKIEEKGGNKVLEVLRGGHLVKEVTLELDSEISELSKRARLRYDDTVEKIARWSGEDDVLKLADKVKAMEAMTSLSVGIGDGGGDCDSISGGGGDIGGTGGSGSDSGGVGGGGTKRGQDQMIAQLRARLDATRLDVVALVEAAVVQDIQHREKNIESDAQLNQFSEDIDGEVFKMTAHLESVLQAQKAGFKLSLNSSSNST